MLATLNYMYDESGGGLLREREVVGGTKTRFHWEGLNLYMEEEWSGSAWVPKRTYINQPSALGGTLARFDLGTSNTLDSSDSGWFYHYDEAGNVILITDKNGGLIKHFEQDAWGNDLNGTFATAQNIRQHQTGKYLDETTGLYFFGARWYDPNIGRFISVSPLSPLGEEEYGYCKNDPISFYDQDGFEGLPITRGTDLIREYLPDSDELIITGWNPDKAYNAIRLIEQGTACAIELSVQTPDDLVGLGIIASISRYGSRAINSLSKIQIWSSKKALNSVENALHHWNQHKREFPNLQNSLQYVQAARAFFLFRPQGTLMKVRKNGDILLFNPQSNIFAVYTKEGVPRTMFKPKNGINYWHTQ